MRDFRFKMVCIKAIPMLFYSIPKGEYMINHREKYTDEQCIKHALRMIRKLMWLSNTTTLVFGEENIIRSGKTIYYSNHQGKQDALGIISAIDGQCSVLWEEKKAIRILAKQVCFLLDSTTIDLDNKRDSVRAIADVTEKVKNGRTYLMFPEGKYDDNKNNLQEFKTGCFYPALKSEGATIVPVALWDAYKGFNINSLRHMTTEVHFLKPIPYEEYKDLKKNELSDLVECRISEKMEELRKIKEA